MTDTTSTCMLQIVLEDNYVEGSYRYSSCIQLTKDTADEVWTVTYSKFR